MKENEERQIKEDTQINKLKVEAFDIIRQQENLKKQQEVLSSQFNQLQNLKRQKIQEIEKIEQSQKPES